MYNSNTNKVKTEPIFQAGDRIRNISSECNFYNINYGKFGTVVRVDIDSIGDCKYSIKYDDGCKGYGSDSDYELLTSNKNNKKTIMNKVSIMMKKLLDARTQKFIKAGFINGDLDITPEGIRTLNRIMFFEKGTEMEAEADSIIAEAENSKKE